MREILFRGKRTNNGEWVYGCALPHDKDACTIFRQHPLTGELEGFEVDPETVGQYTGLTDIHVGKIFEGDIVKYGETVHEVVFEHRFGCGYFGIVMDKNEVWQFGVSVPANKMEVIGNIWDNPYNPEPKDISCEDVW